MPGSKVTQMLAAAPQQPNYFGGQFLRQALAKPLFNHEGPDQYTAAYTHNAPFAKPGAYQTVLPPAQEARFRAWIASQKIPFDPNAKNVDYDMRGFFAANGPQPHTAGRHFPDTYKTPYDTTFSAESRYAKPGTPFVWHGNTLIDSRNWQPVFKPTPSK